MNPIAEDILMHYGVKRRSGRYPWGSGENPYQHGGDFLARVEELEAMGKSQKEIAEELKMSTTDLRMQVRVAKHERRALQAERAKSLREEGKTLDEIAKIMGYNNDSSVRALLNENTASNKNKALATAEALKKELAVKGALDVGEGVEQQLGVSKGVLQEALFILETEGYRKAESDYETAKSKADETRAAYKSGQATRQQVKDAKSAVKTEKRKMENAYEKLKTDKLADEGKKLYQSGKTISGNTQATYLAEGVIIAGSTVVSRLLANQLNNQEVANIAASTIAIGGTIVNGLLAAKTSRENKRLRAYYAH